MKTFLGIMLLIFSVNLHAEQDTKHEKIQELVEVMNMDSMIESMYSQMELMMQDMSTQMGVKPSEQAIFDEYHNKMMLAMRESMSWKKMEPLTVAIYDRNFSEEEISNMLDFYKTDTGKAILAKMPVVMQESMQVSQSLMQETIPKIQEISKQLAEDLQKARASKE